MATIQVTETELLEAIAEATKGGPAEAQTATEIAERTGVHRKQVMKALRELDRQGRLEPHTVFRRSIDGKTKPVVGYTISPAKKGAK